MGKYRNKRLIGAINYHTPVFSTLGDVHRHTSGDGNVALYWFQNKYLGETAQYHFGSSWRSVPNTYHNHKAIVKSTVLYRLKKSALVGTKIHFRQHRILNSPLSILITDLDYLTDKSLCCEKPLANTGHRWVTNTKDKGTGGIERWQPMRFTLSYSKTDYRMIVFFFSL